MGLGGNLPDSWGGSLARVGMIAVVAGVYPLLLAAMVAPLTPERRGVATYGIVGAALAAGLLVTDLGVLNVVNGAVQVPSRELRGSAGADWAPA